MNSKPRPRSPILQRFRPESGSEPRPEMGWQAQGPSAYTSRAMTTRDATANRTPELSWRAHPARERLLAGVLTTLLIVALASAIYAFMGSLAWSILAVLVLVLALNRFYFPSRFVIDDDGISARYLLSRQRYEWSSVRRFLWDRRGVYLSTRRRRSWLDAYRGLNVLFGAHQSEVIKLVRRHTSEVTGR